MKLENGYIYGIIGSNGCGKTTGMDQLFLKNYNNQLIYIKQNNYLINSYNIEENLKFMDYDFKNNSINKRLELDKIRKLYPLQVSLGQRQMVAIIGALYSQSNWIIFDETFSGINKENLLFLLEICKKYVSQYNKTICIITHQKLILNYCDEIINFDDGIPEIELSNIKPKKRRNVKFNDIFIYQKKKILKQVIISIILATCFLFFSLTAYYRNRIYTSINQKVSKGLSTETFILNNTDIYHPYYQNYDIYYSSISTDQVDKLKNIEGLDDFQAYIPFLLEMKENKNNKKYFDPIYIILDNKSEKYDLEIDKQYFINPYTTYSQMEESLKFRTSHNNGIILSQWFCNQIDIDYKRLEDIKIEIAFSIPISQKATLDGMQTAIIDNNGDVEDWRDIKGREIAYQEITMCFPIKGVLDENSAFIARDSCFAFLDQKTMQSIFEKYNQNYIPNAYFAQIQDIGNYEQIQSQVERISPTLELYSSFDISQVSDVMMNFVQILSSVSVILICLFLIITLYTIIMQRKSRFCEYEKLMCHGYHIKDCFEWIFKKYFLDTVLFSFIYLIIFNLCNLYLNYMRYPLISIELNLFTFPILLILLVPIGVDIYTLHKKF